MAAPPGVPDLSSRVDLEAAETRVCVNVVDDWFRGAIDSKMTETLLDGGSRIYQYLRPTAVRELSSSTPPAGTTITKFCSASSFLSNGFGHRGEPVATLN